MQGHQKEQQKEKHPKEMHPKPNFDQKLVDKPGKESDLNPKADHGEHSYKGYNRLQGCSAIITGADSGIGKATAIAYAREGCDVLISYLPEEEEDAKDTEKWVTEAGRKCIRFPGDLAKEDYCKELVKRSMKEFGKVDILVNNAGTQTYHEKIEEFSTDEILHTFQTNIISMFILCREVLPLMKPGSSIINVSSIQAFNPNPILLAYAATKAAIVNFTKGLSKMAIDKGVRVNCVAPGPVWTPLIPSGLPKGKVESFGEESLLGRPAQPAEVAPLFAFLASKEASYVTGEVIGATGGKMPV